MTAVFPIVPASAKPIWFLAALCVLLSIILIALAFTAYSARHSRLEVGNGQLRLSGDFWARSIPFESLQLDHATILDLEKSFDYAPRLGGLHPDNIGLFTAAQRGSSTAISRRLTIPSWTLDTASDFEALQPTR